MRRCGANNRSFAAARFFQAKPVMMLFALIVIINRRKAPYT
jgi:hypothetical protein